MAITADAIRSDSPAAALVEGTLDLVPLPQAYVRIRGIVDDPDSEMREVAEIVATDPALTGRVLRLVNSAFIGLMTPIDSIEHAVRVLGMQQIHDIALATSAVGSLSKLRGDLFDIFEFWRLSMYCGGAARDLAAATTLPSPQRLFVSGLLHGIGNLVMAHEMPQSFDEARVQARAMQRPYYELQRECFGFDYADVSAELMRKWHLPEAIYQPVALHNRVIENLDSAEQPLAAVMSLAAVVARQANWQSEESEPVPPIDPMAQALCGVTIDDLETLQATLDDVVASSLAILLPDY